jgi:cytochrome c oxidase subunit 2
VSASEHNGTDEAARLAARVERRWAVLSVCVLVLLVGMATFAGLHHAVMPQLQVETVDPSTLHIAGEFVERNLGSAPEPDGSVTVRVIGQQYSFTPSCILVPADTPVTIRATSADAIHGFLIQHSNVNTMLVPGYVSLLHTRFEAPGDYPMPCHEFCGVGHEGMWAKVKVVAKNDFEKLAADERRLSCAE